MFKARYYKTDGSSGRARPLPDALFDGVVNDAVLHQVVKAHLANQRQGTGSGKNRSAVAGGSRKPWRQKGTGRARQGTIRAVQWTGGGRAFPPVPHSWRQKVPRKVKALARRSAFNARAAEDRVVLVDAFSMEKPRTAELRDYLASIDLGATSVLVLTDGRKDTVHLSGRNLPHVEVRAFGTESVYDILRAEIVLIERTALDGLATEDDSGGKAGAKADESGAEEQAAGPEADGGEPQAQAPSDEATSESTDAEEDDDA